MTALRLALVAALFLLTAPVLQAADVQDLGSNPSADEIEKALFPNHDAKPALKTRGPHRMSDPNNPGGGTSPAATTAAVPTATGIAAFDIKFLINSAQLNDAGRAVARRLAEIVVKPDYAGFKFRIEGHTDITGPADLNLRLSQDRAASVRDFMVAELGVPGDRLEAIGVGAQNLLDPTHPDSGVNRRVTVIPLAK